MASHRNSRADAPDARNRVVHLRRLRSISANAAPSLGCRGDRNRRDTRNRVARVHRDSIRTNRAAPARDWLDSARRIPGSHGAPGCLRSDAGHRKTRRRIRLRGAGWNRDRGDRRPADAGSRGHGPRTCYTNFICDLRDGAPGLVPGSRRRLDRRVCLRPHLRAAADSDRDGSTCPRDRYRKSAWAWRLRCWWIRESC